MTPPQATFALIKRSLLFFWAAWLSVVVTTNILDAMKSLALLPESFRFVSGNWRWINQVMDPIGVPREIQGAMYLGAIAWETLAAILFWRALAAFRNRPLAHEPEAILACGVNLGLWAAFQILDEVVLAYQPEAVHRMIFANQIATLLLLQLLNDPTSDNKSP